VAEDIVDLCGRKPKKSGRMWVDMGVALGWPHLFVTAQEGNKANEKCVME